MSAGSELRSTLGQLVPKVHALSSAQLNSLRTRKKLDLEREVPYR